MHTLDQLRKAHTDLAVMLTALGNARDKAVAEVAAVANDKTRTADFRQARTTEMRNAALESIGPRVVEAQTLAKNVLASLPFWRSTPFLLSQQSFHKGDLALENATRSRHLAELRAMPAALRRMTFEKAKADGNLALAYLAWLTNSEQQAQPGWKPLDLRDITIPEQRSALNLLTEFVAADGHIGHIVGQVSGRIDQNPIATARARAPQAIEPSVSLDDEPAPPAPVAAGLATQLVGSPEERLNAARTAVKEPA